MGWSKGPELPDEYRVEPTGVPAPPGGSPGPDEFTAPDDLTAQDGAGAAEAGGDEDRAGRARRSRGAIILLGLALWFIISTIVRIING